MTMRGKRFWGFLAVLLAGLAVAGADQGTEPAPVSSPVPAGNSAPERARFPVRVYIPEDVGRAHTGETDPLGRPIRMECAACHSKLEEAVLPPLASEIDSVHTGMVFAHGSLTCFACHDRQSDYSLLRLADDTRLAYAEVMTLCSQCHGPQRKDFDHGAHGGMTGSWDLTRGSRERNACVVCHDAHAPAFPRMQPSFKPIDRFLSPADPEEPPHGR